MSIASKKRRRWRERIERATRQRDAELRLRSLDIRHNAEHWWEQLPPDERLPRASLEERIQAKINELIVYSPEWLIFQEKKRAKREARRSNGQAG